MKAYGEEIVDRKIVQKLLISLPREYDSIAEVIEETKDTETIGVQEDQPNTGQTGSSKSKKNWKPQKWKKWDAKSENNSKKENQTEGAKVPYKTCDELHYGACWFKGKPKRYKCDRFGHVAKDYRGKPAQTTNYATHKEEEVVEIFDDSSKEHLVAKIPMTGNRCFPFSLKYVSSVAMKAIVEESTWCWHRRFGHLNMQSLRLLQQQEMLYGLP
ncbi:unnamed protein product [Prunus armeniaca]